MISFDRFVGRPFWPSLTSNCMKRSTPVKENTCAKFAEKPSQETYN